MQRGIQNLSVKGFSLVELLVALVITALLFTALYYVVNPSLRAKQVVQNRNDTIQAARFAMDKWCLR